MPLSMVVVLYVGTFFLALVGTKGMIVWAHKKNLLDRPNHRSSHTQPTPTAGGVALVGAFYTCVFGLYLVDLLDDYALQLLFTGLPVAVVGYIDDRVSLSARTRLFVQAVCAAIFLIALPSPIPPLSIAGYTIPLPLSHLAYLIGLLWLTNLYNFMDGIDGIAAGQAIVVGILWALAMPDALAGPSVALAVAALGFLVYNYPPARIFMGDVGSSFCGFIIGALALLHAQRTASSPLLWLLPLAPFIADATTTLFTRILYKRSPTEAHRSHAYQRLAHRFQKHLPVSLGYFLISILPLGAIFMWATQFPDYADIAFLTSTGVLMCIATLFGAGRDND